MLSGASRALAPRDRWIGWPPPQQRKANLSWIVNNSRYLIFPWVKVPHLASHVLGENGGKVFVLLVSYNCGMVILLFEMNFLK